MRRTVMVEPYSSGHRFQWVEWVARSAAARGDEITLLTSTGAGSGAQYETFLGSLPIKVEEPFTEERPPTAEIARVLLAEHLREPIDTYIILDADWLLKAWWRRCPRQLVSKRGGPEGILMMTRYPPRWLWRDRKLFVLRLAKTLLSLLTLARRRATRVLFLVGRQDTTPGGWMKKVRDPAICHSHSADRTAIRERQALPADRRLAGILGSISMRKNVPMVFEAVVAAGDDVDLLLAGTVSDDIREWLEALPAPQRARVHHRLGFLSDEDLDAYVAAADVVVVAQSNPGPSGIMGKALAAGVPVLTSASNARQKEAADLGYGIHTEFSVDAIAAGIRSLLADGAWTAPSGVDLPDARDFGDAVLGSRPNGSPRPSIPSEAPT